MTKKNYIAAIAAITKAYQESLNDYPIMKGYVNLNNLMFGFIDMFENDNSLFNRNKFIKAWQQSILPLNK